MNLPPLLTRPAQPLQPWLRCGFLAFCLGLLGWHWSWMVQHAWMPGHETLGLVLVALPLNHLAFRFSWPRPVMIMLRAGALTWIIFALGYWLWLWRLAL